MPLRDVMKHENDLPASAVVDLSPVPSPCTERGVRGEVAHDFARACYRRAEWLTFSESRKA